MVKVKAHISSLIDRFSERIDALYGHDQILKFRATNLVTTIVTVNTALAILFLAFVLAGETILDRQTKLIFGSLIFILILVLALCFFQVFRRRLILARRVIIALAVVSTFGATLMTGGFPGSIAYPALTIPVVLGYCIYGGKIGNLLAVLAVAFAAMQWGLQIVLGVEFPNFASKVNVDANRAMCVGTTFLISVFAMFSFDRSNRLYIEKSEAAAAGKTNFLANMSHEIRTPMNGVIGFSEVMLKTELDERQTTFMEAIHSSGKSLLNIINDILDFSKIEAGHLEIRPAEFNLRDVVSDVVALLSVSAGTKEIAIDLEYPQSLPDHIVGDAGRIRQILMNLVGNAIKFTSEGRVLITVDVFEKYGSPFLRLDVQDTGIGISEDKLDKIFEKFTQAESSTTQRFGGTGLGLTITRRLIELMEGQVGVLSTEGVGSKFWFEIPIDLIAEQSPDQDQLPSGLRNNILLVFDDVNLPGPLANQLTEMGYRPHIAGPQSELLPFLRGSNFERHWMPLVFVGIENTKINMDFIEQLVAHRPRSPVMMIGTQLDPCKIGAFDPRFDFVITPEITSEDLRQILLADKTPLNSGRSVRPMLKVAS